MSRAKILAIGLDGASFNLISPWLDAGLLPNLQKLIKSGVSGELESCIPPVTMPAWRVYSTGKSPGKLGVYWHQQLDAKTRKVITPNGNSFPSADLWHYLNDAGYQTGIVGMPDTYPPQPLNGFMVCAGPSATDIGYTYPNELAEELVEQVNYHPIIKGDLYRKSKDSPMVKQLLDVIDRTFAAGEYLLEQRPVDFLQVTTFDINRLQHVFYDEEPTRQAWEIVDRWLGKLSPRFDYTIIMSDHGTERLEWAFFLNVWLRQQGYLDTRFHPLDALAKMGFNRTNIGRLMQKFGLTRLFSFDTLVKYGSMLPQSTGGFGDFGNQAVVNRIDWSKTRAFALPQGPIYINRQVVPDAAEYEKLRNELVERLESLTDPRTGSNVFKKVYRREELYTGPYIHDAPDLVALDNDAYHNRAGLNQPEVYAPSWKWKGNNRHHGLFVMNGPDIPTGQTLDGVRLIDLAPTILHLANVAVPNDLDGRVIQDGLTGTMQQRQIRYQPPIMSDSEHQMDNEYQDIIEERLKDLGYL